MVSLHLVLTRSLFVDAKAPANDLCINAQPVTIGSNPVPIIFNTTFATTDLDVADDCVNGIRPNYPGIWLNFTGTGGRIVARACILSLYDAYISIYTGGCNPSARQCVAATYYSCDSKRFIFETTLGKSYQVLVQTFNYESVDVSIFSAPVSNDLCVNAQSITIGSSPLPVTFNTTYATTDLDVADDCLYGTPSSPGIWLNFTGTGGRIVARACDLSLFSTYISIYTGGCNPSTRQCVAATIFGCDSGQLIGERFIFETTLGTLYHVLVQLNHESVDVSIFSAPVVSNDLCVNAQSITIGSSPLPVQFNTTYATTDLDVADDCLYGTPNYPGVWFNFTGTGGRIVARACDLSIYNTYISIFTGGCNPSTRQCVAATDTGCDSEQQFIFETTLGTLYHVLVQLNYESVDVSIFSAPVQPCGLFGASIFCPLKFRGIFGRFIRRIFG
jgi:hypothetical protein